MNKKRLILLLALLLWVCFIFSHSLKPAPASNQESETVRQPLSQIVQRELSPAFVRKLAHFAEFGMLGILAAGFFSQRGRCALTALFYSATLSMTVALCDETIQLFSAGRNGRIQDIWLDFAGALAGMAAVLALLCLMQRYAAFARSIAAAFRRSRPGPEKKA